MGSLLGAVGALLAIVPDHLAGLPGVDRIAVFEIAFVAYAAGGLLAGLICRRLPADAPMQRPKASPSLGPSRGIVLRLAALFSVDAFAGGLVIQSLLALWLFQAFDLSVAATAKIFFATNLLSAISYLIAARILASALGPTLGGYLLGLSGFAWPLFLGGALKAIYDLTLLLMFRHVKPLEEQGSSAD